MKKLSIIMLALALALVFTVPAMAIHIDDPDSPEGSLGISGRYQFDGQIDDVDGAKSDYFDDDLDLSITLIKGDVKAFIGLEIADTNPFEGNANKAPVDNYYVEWTASDALKVKIGEYGISYARAIGTDAAGERNIQLTYSLDAVDISGALSKMASSGEDDDDTLMLKLTAKDAGPFTKLSAVSYTEMNDVASAENSYTGVDLALPLGPVALGFEYGANGGDLEGSFILAEIGLEELVGFDVGVNFFQSSDDYTEAFDENAWSPGMILGDNINEGCYDLTAMWLTFGYGVNDNLSVNAALILSAENDAGDAYGNEFDIGLKYKIANNISYALSYGSYSAGDGVSVPDYEGSASGADVDVTELFHRLEFKF